MSAPDTIYADIIEGPKGFSVHHASALRRWADQTEYVRVTPSVRLARWLDGHPDRWCIVQPVGGDWWCGLYQGDELSTAVGSATAAFSRDAALSAALDQAEGAETDG